MKAFLLAILLLQISLEAIAQTDIRRPAIITKQETNNAVNVDLDHVSRTVAYRLLSLESQCNSGLKTISTKTGSEAIPKLLLGKAKDNELKLYYDVMLPSSELTIDDIKRIHNDSLNSVDNLIIYEQWLLDYNTMKMVVKIIAIAPAYELTESEYRPLFWVFFTRNKDQLKRHKLPNGCKEGDVSLYQFLEKREFSSELLDVKKILYKR